MRKADREGEHSGQRALRGQRPGTLTISRSLKIVGHGVEVGVKKGWW